MLLNINRKIPRQARSQALVEAILDATARILVDEGRDHVNTNAIADRAGVSIGSLYQYFSNRDAVLAALAERHARRIHDCVAKAFESPPVSLSKAVQDIAGAIFAAHRIDPALHDAIDHDLGHHPHVHVMGTKPVAQNLLLALPPAIWPGAASDDGPRKAMVASEIIHNLAHVALHRNDWSLEAEAARAALAYLALAGHGPPARLRL